MERIVTKTPDEIDFIIRNWASELNTDSIDPGQPSSGSIWTPTDSSLILSNGSVFGAPPQSTKIWLAGGALTLGDRPTIFARNAIQSIDGRSFEESFGIFVVQYNMLPFIIDKEDGTDTDYTFSWAQRLSAIPGDKLATTAWAASDPALKLDSVAPSIDISGLLSTVYISEGEPTGDYVATNTITSVAGRTLQYSIRVRVDAELIT